MRLVARLAPLVCLIAGCGFVQKPYVNDPLLRDGRAVWLPRDAFPPPPQPPTTPVIEPPKPPTSRRVD